MVALFNFPKRTDQRDDDMREFNRLYERYGHYQVQLWLTNLHAIEQETRQLQAVDPRRI